MIKNSLLDRVSIFEAGKIYVVSGKDEATVNYVMSELKADGARNVTAATPLGTAWLATFEHPLLHQCAAEHHGFRITVTGPTEEIVMLFAQDFIERGAVIEAGPVNEGEHWALYLVDDAARTHTTHFL